MNNPFQSHHTSRVAHKLWMLYIPMTPIHTRVSVVTKPQLLDATTFPRPAEPPSNRLTPCSLRVPSPLLRRLEKRIQVDE